MNIDLLRLAEQGDVSAIRSLLGESLPEKRLLSAALRAAVRAGKSEVFALLVENGADVDSREERSGWSTLHIAVEHKREGSIRRLVELGAKLNVRDLDGVSPLHLAVDVEADALDQIGKEPDTRMVKLLLQLGADPNSRDSNGRTPKDWAIEASLMALADLL